MPARGDAPSGGPFAAALAEAGGTAAAGRRLAGLRTLLADELARSVGELARTRSGIDRPVVAVVAAERDRLLAVVPADPALRADPGTAGGRGWTVLVAVLAALVEFSEPTGLAPVTGPARLPRGLAGAAHGGLLLEMPLRARTREPDELAELTALAAEERLAPVDRLRAVVCAVPARLIAVTEPPAPPSGAGHPLCVAEAITRLGGDPLGEATGGEGVALEEAVLAALGVAAIPTRPHEEQDPTLRIARRIVQRLAGMGKWGGYHTEFVHLSRGFPGHDRSAALTVGERLIDVGLLVEKRSVGQRHVYLNPRRAAEVYALVDRGELPAGLVL